MTTVLLAAMAPATIWLWYFYRRDKRPEPLGMIGLAFLGGVAVVYPVCLVQQRLMPLFPALSGETDFDMLLLSTTVIAGLVEESAKFAVVLAVYLGSRHLDEPVDGLIYAMAAAMGFTAGEDFLRHAAVEGVEFVRLLNVPGHAMFAAFWGFGLGVHMINGRWAPLLARFFFAVFVHGLWDALSFYRNIEGRWWVAGLIFLLAFGLFWALEIKLRWLQDHPAAVAAQRLPQWAQFHRRRLHPAGRGFSNDPRRSP